MMPLNIEAASLVYVGLIHISSTTLMDSPFFAFVIIVSTKFPPLPLAPAAPKTLITKEKKGESITVVDDMWMSPTYTKDAALTLKRIIESKLPYGTYHATNSGYCSWYQFAEGIFQVTGLNPVLTPIKSEQLNMKAKRPRFSALRSIKLSQYSIETRGWKEALHAYLVEKGHIQRGS